MKFIKPPKFLAANRFGQVIFTLHQIIKILWRINPWLLSGIIILNILWGVLSLPAFYLEKLILDAIVKNLGNPFWQEVLKIIAFLFLARATVEFLRLILGKFTDFLRYMASRLFSAEIDLLLGQKIAELDAVTLEDPEFQDRFNKIDREGGRRAWGLMVPLSNIPNYLSGFLSAIGLLFFLHPLVALAVVLFSVPQFLVDAKFIRKEYELESVLSPLYRLWGWMTYYLLRSRNFLELKILKLGSYLVERIRRLQKEIFSPQIDLERQRMMSHLVIFLPSTFLVLGLNIWLAFLAITKRITVGSAEMYMRAILATQTNIGGLVSAFLEIYENYLYVQELNWLLALTPIIQEEGKGRLLPKRLKKGITFQNVWFRYKKDSPWVLKSINLAFKPGERIALVGENGSGKSTLIKLLARFYDPDRGKILVEGEDLAKVNLLDFRNRLGILFQRFETYPFTARESIGYGDVARVERLAEIQLAAQQTGIHPWILELPFRYENPLAPDFEKGIEPSFGQWQRIALSRILFRKNSEILVLDEPTSNVDPKAEEAIFSKITRKAGKRLLIFVSQRFSTVRRADRILVMEKGRITEQGTHKELMKLDGTYAELFSLQAKGYQ